MIKFFSILKIICDVISYLYWLIYSLLNYDKMINVFTSYRDDEMGGNQCTTHDFQVRTFEELCISFFFLLFFFLELMPVFSDFLWLSYDCDHWNWWNFEIQAQKVSFKKMIYTNYNNYLNKKMQIVRIDILLIFKTTSNFPQRVVSVLYCTM